MVAVRPHPSALARLLRRLRPRVLLPLGLALVLVAVPLGLGFGFVMLPKM